MCNSNYGVCVSAFLLRANIITVNFCDSLSHFLLLSNEKNNSAKKKLRETNQ